MSPFLLLLAALPANGDYPYTLLLNDVPVAVVDLEVTDKSLSYKRTFYFSRGARSDVSRFPRAGKETLASFALLTPLPVGCLEARDESSSKHGKLCVTRAEEGTVEGTLFGDAFTALYRGGVLLRLELPTSKFVRGELKPVRDAFDQGFEIDGEGPRVAFAPGVPGVIVRPVKTMAGVKAKGNCLERAEAIAAAHPGKYEVAIGLVEDNELMWPHAWLIENETRLGWDPTLPKAEDRLYVQFPAAAAGDVYLKLLAKKMRIIRALGMP